MARTIRFHLDEHGASALAEGLRRRGVDITMTHEAGLAGASDEEQLAYALEQTRVIFTQDDDYLRLHAAGLPHAGIAYCHQGQRSLGEQIRGLLLIWEIFGHEDMMGRVEYL